jgi:hypothetical protein
MHLQAAHCRKQQALQLEIAANSSLESRRQIALKAAAAWGVEAALAEKRESGQLTQRDKADLEIAKEFALEEEALDDEAGNLI